MKIFKDFFFLQLLVAISQELWGKNARGQHICNKKVVLLHEITCTYHQRLLENGFSSCACFNRQLLKSIVFNKTCAIKKTIGINIKVRKSEGEVAER